MFKVNVNVNVKENTVDKTTEGSIDFEPSNYVTRAPLNFTPSPSLKKFSHTVQDFRVYHLQDPRAEGRHI